MLNKEIDDLLRLREGARGNRDWESSDTLRNDLKALGVTVVDTDEGQEADGGSKYTLEILQIELKDSVAQRLKAQEKLNRLTKLMETQKKIILNQIWKDTRSEYLGPKWKGTYIVYKRLLEVS